jgi:hypothetical protein
LRVRQESFTHLKKNAPGKTRGITKEEEKLITQTSYAKLFVARRETKAVKWIFVDLCILTCLVNKASKMQISLERR